MGFYVYIIKRKGKREKGWMEMVFWLSEFIRVWNLVYGNLLLSPLLKESFESDIVEDIFSFCELTFLLGK